VFTSQVSKANEILKQEHLNVNNINKYYM